MYVKNQAVLCAVQENLSMKSMISSKRKRNAVIYF